MKNINFKIIISFLGLTSMMNGLFMLIAVPISLYYKESEALEILWAGLTTLFIGALLYLFTRNNNKNLQKKDGYLIVTFGWVMLTLTGTLPYLFTQSIPHFPDALFEAISGYSTTGASILRDIEAMPKGILFWRSATHWIGGMGIIVLTIAILPMLGIGGMQLFMAEAPGPSADKMHPRITETAKRLWLIYFILTFSEMLLLKIAGMGWFDAANHAMATMSTGGFSTKNASLAHWNHLPWIQYIVIIFMFIAGANFLMSYFVLKGKFIKVIKNEEFKFYFFGVIGIVLVVSLLIFFYQDPLLISSISHPKPFGELEHAIRHGAFQVISVITTTGFVSADYTMWNSFATVIIFSLFFLGGSAGSTSGGVKIVRHIIMIKNALLEFKKILHPHAIIPVRYNDNAVQEKVVFNILSFFILYMGIFITSSILLSFMGLDILTAFGAAASSLGNIGPAFGKLSPVDHYAWLSDTAKVFISFLMLIGRLELFTVLVILTPYFWKKN